MNGPQITLIGRLTRDPGELRYTANDGTAYTRTGVAVNTYKNRGTEQETTFFNITLWGSHAENLMNRCRKGDQIYIQGGYSFREYTRAEGGRGLQPRRERPGRPLLQRTGSQPGSQLKLPKIPTPPGKESLADETSRSGAPVEEMPEAGAPVEEMPEAGTPAEEIRKRSASRRNARTKRPLETEERKQETPSPQRS